MAENDVKMKKYPYNSRKIKGLFFLFLVSIFVLSIHLTNFIFRVKLYLLKIYIKKDFLLVLKVFVFIWILIR